MIGQMAIAIALPGFNDLGRSVSDPYFCFDESFSLLIFYVWQKKEEILLTRSLNFLQNALSNSVLFSSSFICVTVSNASQRVKF